jgi:Sec7-like guanine-nucleotide exchange factor
MFNLFWFFLIVDHELRSPTTRGRITSSHFIRTIREAYPKQLVDKAALKAIYEDIKKKPLISRTIHEEPQTIELPPIHPTTSASSTSSSTTRSSPNNLSEPIRKWWRKIRRQSTEAHSDSRINYDPNIPFRNLDDTTQHRPPPRIAL